MGGGELYGELLRARTTSDTAAALSTAQVAEVSTLPIDTVEAVLGALAGPPDSSLATLHVGAQCNILTALPTVLKKANAAVARLLIFYTQAVKLGGEQVSVQVAQKRTTAAAELAELIASQIRAQGAEKVSLASISQLCETAPLSAAASVIAALGEKGRDGDEMAPLAGHIGRAPAETLSALQPEALIRLAVASTKSTAVAEGALDAVAVAASSVLSGWSMDDVAKLLLALARAKGGSSRTSVAALFRRASEVVTPQLQALSVVQLIKVVLAISQVPDCRGLLEAAATEAAGRASDLPCAQLVLLTQGLVSLGGEHQAVSKVVDLWTSNLSATEGANGMPGADQLARLAQLLAPVAPDSKDFWAALGQRLVEVKSQLTTVGQDALEAAFPGGEGPEFEGKTDLLKAFKKRSGGDEKEKSGKDRSDRGDRGDREDRGDRDRGDRDRGDRGDRDRGDRDRDREREKDRDRRKEREPRKGRSRSRSRSRDRQRRGRSRSRSGGRGGGRDRRR